MAYGVPNETRYCAVTRVLAQDESHPSDGSSQPAFILMVFNAGATPEVVPSLPAGGGRDTMVGEAGKAGTFEEIP